MHNTNWVMFATDVRVQFYLPQLPRRQLHSLRIHKCSGFGVAASSWRVYHCAGGGDARHDDIPTMAAPARLPIHASPSLYQLLRPSAGMPSKEERHSLLCIVKESASSLSIRETLPYLHREEVCLLLQRKEKRVTSSSGSRRSLPPRYK